MSFFNYHEYEESNPSNPSRPIIVTHFPNPYPSPQHFPNPYPSSQQNATRIVRIPRLTTEDYPKFSTVLPGHEEGATTGTSTAFHPLYELNNQWFGETSISPLSNYLTATEFNVIVTKINDYLEDQYSPSKSGMIYMVLNTLSFGLINGIGNTDKLQSFKLENYINQLNDGFQINHKDIRIVDPRLSGYLSLDFQVPKPVPGHIPVPLPGNG